MNIIDLTRPGYIARTEAEITRLRRQRLIAVLALFASWAIFIVAIWSHLR